MLNGVGMTPELFSLRCTNVQKSVVVHGLLQQILVSQSLLFEQGHMYVLLGPSGSGKTTLLNLLGGLDDPTFGQVELLVGEGWKDTFDLASMKPEKKMWYLQSIVGMVFQFHYLVQELTAFENILLPAQIVGFNKQKNNARALELLEFVGLAARKNAYPATLSGGERQRVALARALMNNPKFILADEPTGSLDPQNARQVKDLLVQAVQKYKSCVIVATHDSALFSGEGIERIEL